MSTLRQRPDPGSGHQTDRPPIWINGRQRPSFDWRSYGAYSVIATRAALGPALARLAGTTLGLQARLLAGAYRINTARLGRAAAYLPARPTIAATVGGVAALINDAAEVVSPPAPAVDCLAAHDALWPSRMLPSRRRLRGICLDEVQSDPDLRALREDRPLRALRPTRRPVLVRDVPPAATAAPPAAGESPHPATTTGTEQATLMAIRSMLQDALPAPDPAPDPAPAAAARPRKPPPAWTGPVWRMLRRMTALAIGWGLIALAMPLGLVKAGIAHLDGRDLRDLVEGE